MRKKYETEFEKLSVLCVCDLEKKLNIEVQIIKGSNDGETFTDQEIKCPDCRKEKFIIEVPGRVPADPAVRLS